MIDWYKITDQHATDVKADEAKVRDCERDASGFQHNRSDAATQLGQHQQLQCIRGCSFVRILGQAQQLHVNPHRKEQ
jgi:hypothetical protein